MNNADYSEKLTESATDGHWKTAYQVDPADFPKVTRRLRYQAGTLKLMIKIETDKQKHTVSFLTWKGERA
jgi:hypothetical protein